ncbi:cytochrome P450 [Cupriavidus sp. AU9028]|uniref:cytochrome P450 n=1 Tax=Cupriavidus sp. AU9028 TaxID=2871157 RepID=UPI001C955EAC|nr:cytochrome P450 [Cupriavidus sp. AU9028]MBY4895854.1 cytochrome P450 [Cupriavidus sp. AU9028]
MSFQPPYPKPHVRKSSFLLRFLRGWNSWIHVLFERSYSMKMGKISQPGMDIFMVNDADWVRKILADTREYPKHRLMHRMLEPLLGSSIFTTNGPTWERQRRLVEPAFAQARLKLVFSLMADSVAGMVTRLDAVADGRSWEVDGEMTYVTADIIFRTILSENLEEADAKAIYDAFLDFQHHAQRAMILMIYRLPAFFARRASARAAAKIRAILSQIIKRRFDAWERGERGGQEDILAGLMAASDPVSGDRFSYEELVDQVCMLFLAGHETSASALTWALYLISNCPHLQDRMHEEILAVVGDRPFELGDIKSLPAVGNVFRETLRLYPPVGFFVREAMQTACIRDKEVKEGSPILISPWLIHRHRSLWERPDDFDPERFDTPAGKESARCAYIPFSKGPRVCIGAAYATQEAVLILATIVRRYRVEAVAEHVPQVVGRVTIRSGNGVRVRLRRR